MYKIFINQGLLSVSANGSDKPEDATQVQLSEMAENDLLPLIERFEEEAGLKIFIIHPDPDRFIAEHIHKYFEPITAAGGLVRNVMDQVLFIKRHGLWDLPKGKQDKGESVEETALREVMEECGINHLDLKHKITSTFHAYTLKGKRQIKTTHWFAMFTDESEDLTPQMEEDITEVEWFGEEEIEIALENTYPLIREVVDMELENSGN